MVRDIAVPTEWESAAACQRSPCRGDACVAPTAGDRVRSVDHLLVLRIFGDDVVALVLPDADDVEGAVGSVDPVGAGAGVELVLAGAAVEAVAIEAAEEEVGAVAAVKGVAAVGGGVGGDGVGGLASVAEEKVLCVSTLPSAPRR